MPTKIHHAPPSLCPSTHPLPPRCQTAPPHRCRCPPRCRSAPPLPPRRLTQAAPAPATDGTARNTGCEEQPLAPTGCNRRAATAHHVMPRPTTSGPGPGQQPQSVHEHQTSTESHLEGHGSRAAPPPSALDDVGGVDAVQVALRGQLGLGCCDGTLACRVGAGGSRRDECEGEDRRQPSTAQLGCQADTKAAALGASHAASVTQTALKTGTMPPSRTPSHQSHQQHAHQPREKKH